MNLGKVLRTENVVDLEDTIDAVAVAVEVNAEQILAEAELTVSAENASAVVSDNSKAVA